MIFLLFTATCVLGFANAMYREAYVAAVVCALLGIMYAFLFQRYILHRRSLKNKGS